MDSDIVRNYRRAEEEQQNVSDIETINNINNHLRSVSVTLSELSDCIVGEKKEVDETRQSELICSINYIEKNRAVLPKLVKNEVETVLKDIKGILSRKLNITFRDDFV